MNKYVVRYGSMRSLGIMSSREETEFRRGTEVIVRTNRGLEAGIVLCVAHDDALSHLDQPPTGQIIRVLSGDDANAVVHIDAIFVGVGQGAVTGPVPLRGEPGRRALLGDGRVMVKAAGEGGAGAVRDAVQYIPRSRC